MKKIYETKEWKGYGKQNYYRNEYHLEGDTVTKTKCHRFKHFNGEENEWFQDKKIEQTWNINDSSLPDWLRKLI